MFIALMILAREGINSIKQDVPLQDASNMVRFHLSQFHLTLERHIYINRAADVKLIFNHLDKAQWYAGAMLNGGRDSEWTYIPEKDPVLRGKLIEISVTDTGPGIPEKEQ